MSIISAAINSDYEIEAGEMSSYLAEHFDNMWNFYLKGHGVNSEVNKLMSRIKSLVSRATQIAMAECLSLWRRHNPSTATLRTLLEILTESEERRDCLKCVQLLLPKTQVGEL